MNKLLAVALLTVCGATAALADGGTDHRFFERGDHDWQRGEWNHRDGSPGDGGQTGGTHMSAPEIDPASAGGAVALLVGGLLVLRSRVKHRG